MVQKHDHRGCHYRPRKSIHYDDISLPDCHSMNFLPPKILKKKKIQKIPEYWYPPISAHYKCKVLVPKAINILYHCLIPSC